MPEYDGFISYCHSADVTLAPAVQRALSSLAKPWYRIRALHIFRDETNLSANPALWTSIETALSRARWFVYLASPRAAQSVWVQREIQWWLSNRDADSLLIVHTEGTLRWDSGVNDFDWSVTDAVPRGLSGRFANEPLWVDLSWARGLDNLSLRHSRFRSAILSLASTMHGRAPEEIDGEDIRQHRRTRHVAGAAIITLASLTIISIAAAYLAIRRGRESVSRELAMVAIQQLEVDPELGLRLALTAAERAPTQQAEDALRRALGESKVRYTLPLREQGMAMAFSPSGTILALAAGRELVLFDTQTNRTRVLEHRDLTPLVAFSRDARFVTTGSWDGTAHLWDVASGKHLLEVKATSGELSVIELSPGGDRLLTVGDDEENEAEEMVARLWDTKTGRRVVELKGHTRQIAAARFDGTGERIVTGGWDNAVRIWAAETGALLRTLTGHREVVDAVAFSPDGALVLSGSRDLTVRCWDATSGTIKAVGGRETPVRTHPEINEHFVSLSPSTRIAVAVDGPRATLYDAYTGKELRQLADVPGSLSEIAFSEDETMIAAPGPMGVAFVWDAGTGRQIATFRGNKGDLTAVAFHPNGRLLFTTGSDATARAWTLEEGGRDLTLAGHNKEVTHAIWSPDGELVATGSSDETIRIWDAHTGKPNLVLSRPGRVSSLSFSSDSQRLLVARYDAGGAHVFDAHTGAVLTTFTGRKTRHEVLEEADWSPDEKVVFASINNHVFRWDARSGARLSEFPATSLADDPLGPLCGYSRATGRVCVRGSDETVLELWDVTTGTRLLELDSDMSASGPSTMSPDGRRVAWSDLQQVEIWDTQTKSANCRIPAQEYINALEFDPGGTRIATGGGEGDPIVRIWDTASCALLLELSGHSHSVESVRFSPDGQLLVTVSQDGTARVWRFDEGRTIAVLQGHGDMLFDVRISPDARRVLTASADGTARVFDTSYSKPLRELIALARDRHPRQLTPAEARQFLH